MAFLFRKKISSQEMADGLYRAFIEDGASESLEGIDGEILLDKKEMSLIILSHIYNLLNRDGLSQAALWLLARYSKERMRAKDSGEGMLNMAILTSKIREVNDFWDRVAVGGKDGFTGDSLFGKRLNPIQRTLVLGWYTNTLQSTSKFYEKIAKKFRVTDSEEQQ